VSIRKLLIVFLLIPLFNDIILLKGQVLLTLPKLLLFPTIFLVMMILLVKKQLFISKFNIKIASVFLFLIVFSLANNIVTSTSLSIIQSIVIGIVYMITLTSVIILDNYKKTMDNFIFALKVINISAIINAFLGIIQSLTGHFYISERKFLAFGGSLYRAQGLFEDPNYFGQVIILSIFISYYLYKKLNSTFYKISVVILLLGIILSGSRGTLLVFIIVILGYFYLKSKRKILFLIVISLFCIILPKVLTSPVVTLLPPQLQYLTTVFDTSLYTKEAARNSLQDRFELLNQAIEIGKEYWYKGVGIGNFPLYNPIKMFSHNTLAEMFAEYGVVGIISFCYLFLWLPYDILKKYHQSINRDLQIIVLGFFGYVLMSLTVVSYYTKFTFLAFSLLVILRLIYVNWEKNNENKFY
jgi:O-antigen ligase